MTNTGLSTKTNDAYKLLVENFLKDSKIDVDPMEKEKFLAICMVNKLNPYKGEIYPIPRNKKVGDKRVKTLTPVIDYNQFLKRAEESGKLSGWNILLTRDGDKINGGTITIYRKDRQQPFTYSALVSDFLTYTDVKTSDGKKTGATKLENPLWATKTEAMMRKQLIRVGFAAAFPENCGSLNIEDLDKTNIPISASEVISGDEVDGDPELPKTEVITQDQISSIVFLSSFLPGDVESPDTKVEADEMIYQMQEEIGRRFIKEKSINLTAEEIEKIFVGSRKTLAAMKKAALEILSPKAE